MKRNGKVWVVSCTLVCASWVFLQASEPTVGPGVSPTGNSSYLYTKLLAVQDSGVVKIPAGYVWSAETSSRGLDVQGNNLPDSRIMLRLHNPDVGFSALTSQLDLATAAKLHHELGELIVKKLQDPNYQDRPHVSSGKTGSRTRTTVGVDANGVAIIKDSTK